MIWNDGVERPDPVNINNIIENKFNEFIESSKLIERNGLAVGSGGNLSIKVPGGILITSSGSQLSGPKLDEIIFVFYVKGNDIYYCGSKKPSSETIMHWMIYENRPDIKAISHVNVGPKDEKEIITSKDEITWGTRELGEDTANTLQNTNVMMLKNHGIIAVDKNLVDATKIVVEYADNKKPYIFT
jgi:ribulose-5-phosphate 4-epimerase/fuculose-1-phosphate aldolase